MKQALGLLALILAGLEAGRVMAGQDAVLAVVSGALALMALMIAATFLWLWFERTTPLALGMAHSWLGAGLIAGLWWWALRAGGGAGTPPPALALALALLLAQSRLQADIHKLHEVALGALLGLLLALILFAWPALA
jgi:hypothetical protein